MSRSKPSGAGFALAPTGVALLCALVCACMLAGSASAATFTWDGGGSDNNITTAQNWVGDVVPGANSDIIWAGTVRLNVNVNIGGPGSSFTFSNTAGAFIISGAASSLSSGVTNNSTNLETINIPLTLTGAQTFNAASGNLMFGGTTLANGGFLLTIGGANNTTITNVISGSGGLTKTGAGTLILSGANSYTGAATVSTGVLNLQNATGLGTTAAGTTVTSGAALQLQGGIAVGNETLSLNGTGLSSTGALRNISGNNSWAGTITINSTTRINSDSGTLTLNVASGNAITGSNDNLEFGGAGNVTINDAIATGTGSLTKDGTGTLLLSGANTYTGATNVNAGTLRIGGNNRIENTSDLNVSGGTFDLQTYSDTVRNVTLSSGSISGTGTLTALTYAVQSGTASARLAGAGATMTKTTAGTVTLTGANTFTGATTVSGGTLTLSAAGTGALGFTSGITVNSGGTLLLGASNQINNTAPMALNGGTFARGTSSEGGTNSAGVGALTLSGLGSHLNFGAGTVGTLTFASFAPGGNTLTIDNWTGTAATIGNIGTDRLVFNSDQTANLGSFNFTGYAPGATQFNLTGGFYEIVPTAVPEPATYILGLLTFAAVLFHHRKQIRAFSHRRIATPGLG